MPTVQADPAQVVAAVPEPRRERRQVPRTEAAARARLRGAARRRPGSSR
jgi:hypothetical protein